jgi:pSer/pThr/pTyr-binding forkhead associated (FHA) protein
MIHPSTDNAAWLIPLAGGPTLKPLRLASSPQGHALLIGRGDTCNLRLEDARVSRPHAELVEDRGTWRILGKGIHGPDQTAAEFWAEYDRTGGKPATQPMASN